MSSQSGPGRPAVPEVGVLGLVPDRWSALWQPRHQVLTRLAHYFHVVWVEPAREWREVLRGSSGIDRGRVSPSIPRSFVRYRHPSWLPRLHRPRALADGLETRRLLGARKNLERRGCRHIVLYLWRPQFGHALERVPHDLSCYHIDDEYSWSEIELPLDPEEARLIQKVDQVFVHSPALLEKKGSLNPNTAFVPNGVDYEAHARPVDEPLDLRAVAHPRIGYTGYLKTQLDFPLLSRLVDQHRDWSFVFVGAVQHDEIRPFVRSLDRRPNVHFLGPKSFAELTSYPQHFDVCTMPYVLDGYTKFIYPLKLHEYLASGSPVVGSPIRALQDYAHVVELAEGPEEWSNALARSLRPEERSPERTAARRDVARRHDWNVLVREVADRMADGLGLEAPWRGRTPVADAMSTPHAR